MSTKPKKILESKPSLWIAMGYFVLLQENSVREFLYKVEKLTATGSIISVDIPDIQNLSDSSYKTLHTDKEVHSLFATDAPLGIYRIVKY